MALYMYVCERCHKKIYLNMSDMRLFIAGGRRHVCPTCMKKLQSLVKSDVR
ncbi:MAG: hypothetical protein K6F66_00865 [Pseudobutyrivibrio sp.]|nr:hypothetical protein [Pseudobutyrivibrio sp.]